MRIKWYVCQLILLILQRQELNYWKRINTILLLSFRLKTFFHFNLQLKKVRNPTYLPSLIFQL